MDEVVDLVGRSLADGTRDEFDRRVADGAAFLHGELRSGALDSGDPAVGIELELYAVDDEGRPTRVPEAAFDAESVNPELGVHNLEVNSPPALLTDDGIKAQADAVRDALDAVAAATDSRPVLDAMWTVPPPEGTRPYLSATREVEGVTLAENMHRNARYHALDNDVLDRAGGTIPIDLPGFRGSFPTILVESLATSMQPHLQVPDVEAFPAHYAAAIRTLGPVLALATNSPFLPADLYGDRSADRVLDATAHELRIPVFEQAINAGQDRGKVRFPDDVASAADAVDRVVADETLAPFLAEWVADDGDAYEDSFWEYSHKHGTYWRWLRSVIGGDHIDDRNDERSLRIEYRPLPTQPSVRDVIGFQCLVAGLIRGLVAADHPLPDLDWNLAREAFYDAVDRGLDADLHWVTAGGAHTTDAEVVYGEVFEYARRGLRDAGVSRSTVETYVRPVERRWEARATPSDWKIAGVRDRVADGADLETAISGMQREYARRSAAGEPFADWA